MTGYIILKISLKCFLCSKVIPWEIISIFKSLNIISLYIKVYKSANTLHKITYIRKTYLRGYV